MPRPWHPTPFLTFSIVLTLLGGLLAAVAPACWPVWLGLVLSDHLVLVGSGFVPWSTLLGANLSRLPQRPGAPARVALTFDDGPDPETTPAILAILAARDTRATFFCVGSRARTYPDLVRAIARAGHEIGNHSWSHAPWFWFLGPAALTEQIISTQRVLGRLAGTAPAWFRAPAGIRSPLLDLVLCRLGLRLVSWSRRGFDTVDRNAERVSARLTMHLGAGDILVLHDRASSRDPKGQPIVLSLLPRLLDTIAARGLATVTLGETLMDDSGARIEDQPTAIREGRAAPPGGRRDEIPPHA